MERINVRVNEELKQELEAEARAKGINPSDVVREALQEHFRARPRRETCLDIARRIGLIGCAKGQPKDLSTNRDHFEGFGRG
jgi:Arc/MetJ-type ribon-helix-helix transcriptional regulator